MQVYAVRARKTDSAGGKWNANTMFNDTVNSMVRSFLERFKLHKNVPINQKAKTLLNYLQMQWFNRCLVNGLIHKFNINICIFSICVAQNGMLTLWLNRFRRFYIFPTLICCIFYNSFAHCHCMDTYYENASLNEMGHTIA